MIRNAPTWKGVVRTYASIVGIEKSLVVTMLSNEKENGKTEMIRDVYVRPAKKRGILRSGVADTRVVIEIVSALSSVEVSVMIILAQGVGSECWTGSTKCDPDA